MKVISLWQPWASLIALGLKQIETRSWPTTYRGPLLIHAAKKWNRELEKLWCKWMPNTAVIEQSVVASYAVRCDVVPLGAIVCQCELVDCREMDYKFLSIDLLGIGSKEEEFGDYRIGRHAWFLANVKPLKTPIPCVGRQGFFEFSG